MGQKAPDAGRTDAQGQSVREPLRRDDANKTHLRRWPTVHSRTRRCEHEAQRIERRTHPRATADRKARPPARDANGDARARISPRKRPSRVVDAYITAKTPIEGGDRPIDRRASIDAPGPRRRGRVGVAERDARGARRRRRGRARERSRGNAIARARDASDASRDARRARGGGEFDRRRRCPARGTRERGRSSARGGEDGARARGRSVAGSIERSNGRWRRTIPGPCW